MNLVLADVQQDALDKAVAEMEAAGAQVLGMRVDVSQASAGGGAGCRHAAALWRAAPGV